ncbi:MAG: hypothetical protein LLG02_02900 [Pelosinus sp.]|nr:hypothetical protein [Pelosinus sp.]
MTIANNAVNTAAGTSTSAASSTKKTGNTSLGKDDFLKLLITQMGHQDPLNPTDETQQLAQLAQFSSLEQMQNMNVSTRTAQAVNMISSAVSWNDDSGNYHEGIVSSVNIKDGEPQLGVAEDYTTVDLTKVVGQTLAGTVAITGSDGKPTTTTLTGTIKAVKGTDLKPLFVVDIDAYDSNGKATVVEKTIDPSDSSQIKGVTISGTAALDKVTSIMK